MKIVLILKNGYRFTGQILEETENKLIINDIKLGRMEIDKASIAARSGEQ